MSEENQLQAVVNTPPAAFKAWMAIIGTVIIATVILTHIKDSVASIEIAVERNSKSILCLVLKELEGSSVDSSSLSGCLAEL